MSNKKLMKYWPKFADTGKPIPVFSEVYIWEYWYEEKEKTKPEKRTVTGFNWLGANYCTVTFNDFKSCEPRAIFTSYEAAIKVGIKQREK